MYKGQTLNLTEHLQATCFQLKMPGPVVLGRGRDGSNGQ